MCEHCERGKAVKYDREAMVMITHSMFDEDVIVMQCIDVWRGLFGRPKYGRVLFDLPINYCPMCGRKLGGDV